MASNSLAELPLEHLLTNPAHHQRIEQIARRSTRGMGLAWEDAAQAAHFKVLQAAQNGNFYYGGIEEFYHWAMAVAKSAIVDLVRREYRRTHISLNQPLTGTNLTLLDTIPEPQQSWDVLERADLMVKVRDAITELEQRYPQRHYRLLWQCRVEGMTQVKIASRLGISQGAVSKRWQELVRRICQYLGLDLEHLPQSQGQGYCSALVQQSDQLLEPDSQDQLRQRPVASW